MVLELLYVLFSVMALNFPFNTRCSNEQLKNVLMLFGFQDKCPIEFVLSRTFVLLQSKWKWAPGNTVKLVKGHTNEYRFLHTFGFHKNCSALRERERETDNYVVMEKKCNGKKIKWRCRGSNPGPFTCKANAVPLSYIAILEDRAFIVLKNIYLLSHTTSLLW